MSYAEELLKIRKKVMDAVGYNVFNVDNKDIIEALLIQIMNDAEKNRQQCLTQAENFRKQASTMDGQAGAFSSMSSIIYNVLNGFVKAAERTQEEKDLHIVIGMETKPTTSVLTPIVQDNLPAKKTKKK